MKTGLFFLLCLVQQSLAVGDFKEREISSIRPHITGKGLNNVVNAIFPLVHDIVLKERIPDIGGKSNGFKFGLTNIYIRELNVPTVDIQVGGNDAWNPSVQHISGRLTLDWRYKLDSWPGWPAGDGWAEVKLWDAYAILNVRPVPGAAMAGQPPITVADVQVGVPHLDVSIHGSDFAWLYEQIIAIARNDIKNAISKNLRNVLNDVLNKEMNKAWGSIPFRQNIDDIILDLGIVSEPRVSPARDASVVDGGNPVNANIPAYVELFGNGVFESAARECTAIPRSPTLERYNCQGAMDYILFKEKSVSVVVDEYVASSALCAWHARGSLYLTVEDHMIPQDSPVRLNTKSFLLVIPQLPKAYPDKEMRLSIITSKVPSVVLSSVAAQSQLTAYFNVSAQVKLANEQGEPFWQEAFVLGLVAKLSFDAKIENTHLSAHADLISSELSLVSSNIGNFPTFGLNFFFNNIVLPKLLLPLGNEFLGKGFDLPIPIPVQPVNGILAYGDGCLAVGTDIMYIPRLGAAPASEAAEAPATHTHTHTPGLRGADLFVA